MQVVSSKASKTIIVAFHSYSEHPIYHKRVQKTSRVVAHDEDGSATIGDYVAIIPCRPVSKTKRFKLEKIVKKYAYAVDETTGCGICHDVHQIVDKVTLCQGALLVHAVKLGLAGPSLPVDDQAFRLTSTSSNGYLMVVTFVWPLSLFDRKGSRYWPDHLVLYIFIGWLV